MSTNVITHNRFGGEDTVSKLREAGVIVESALTDEQIADMKLTEPSYGEQTVGTLDEAEAAIFYAMWAAKREVEDRGRTALGKYIARTGTKISESDRDKPFEDIVAGLAEEQGPTLDFDGEEGALDFFRQQQMANMLRGLFWWQVGERLGMHHHRLGVRSKLRVVAVEQRY